MMNWKKKWILFICSLLPIFVAAVWCGYDQIVHNYVLELELCGSEEILLEYGETYREEGAAATGYGVYFDEEKREIPVKIQGTVDDRTVGVYTVTYRASFEKITKSLTRTVRIADTTPPIITLTENPDSYTLPGQPYEEEGFTAQDLRDGDLTEKVEREEISGKVFYTVSDSAGNVATACREIRYDDPIPPVLGLKGETTAYMMAGKAYTDPGCWAQDNCDGDISAKITVSGTVDGNTPGTYTLQYSVQDSYGNIASATRVVVVTEHIVQEYVENPEKVIYLTFDDGPGPNTPVLLDILKKYNVKATFFVVNTDWIDTVRRASAEGHTVAMHTATHDFHEIYASEEAYFNDLYKMQEVIYDLTGVKSMLMRFPGGSSNTISCFNEGIMTRLTAMVKEKGFIYFDWNVDSDDAGCARTADAVYANVIAGIGSKNTAIVLQHDVKDYSIGAVERIIVWGLENGYTFRPLTPDSPTFEHGTYN